MRTFGSSLLTCTVLAIASVAARGQETSPATPGGFVGWVHVTYPPSDRDSVHVNNLTGATITITRSGPETVILYLDPQARQLLEYHSRTRIIRIGSLSEEKRRQLAARAAATPFNVQTVGARLQELAQEQLPAPVRTTERGLERYDFKAAVDAVRRASEQEHPELSEIPSVVWVDPVSGLVRQALFDQMREYRYDGKQFTSIYDAGAPRDAKIIDDRPPAEALAILDRMEQRRRAALPDGVYVQIERPAEGADAALLTAYEQAGDRWISRNYRIRTSMLENDAVDLPADPFGAGAEELFKRLAAAAPMIQWSGDARTVALRDPLDKPPERQFRGIAAQRAAAITSPAFQLFRVRAEEARNGSDIHLEVVRSPQEPDLLALRATCVDSSNEAIRMVNEYWLDPGHADRFVRFEERALEAASASGTFLRSSGPGEETTEFQTHDTLPDGRAYATAWVRTTHQGQQTTVVQGSFHYFPDRKLPPGKAMAPATQPWPDMP